MESVGNYQFLTSDILGHGAFAIVFKGYKKCNTKQEVAIKKIRKSSFVSLNFKELKEIAILMDLQHENIVKLFEYHETKLDLFLILEYCNLGDMNEFLQCYHHLPEEVIRYFFIQIGNAIHFIHSHNIIHRDLKPQNILLHAKNQFIPDPSSPQTLKRQYSNINLKISDFGFARVLSDTTMATTMCGSPLYMAPEILLGERYDSKVDMWSIGAIIFQSLTGSAPFTAKTPHMLKKRFESDLFLRPSIPNNTSFDLKSLINGLLKRNSNIRLGYCEFCSHPFFTRFLVNDALCSVNEDQSFLSSMPQSFNSSKSKFLDHQYMFVNSELPNQYSIPFSLDPPTQFEVSPITKLPLNQYPCSSYRINIADDDNDIKNGYILIDENSHNRMEKKIHSPRYRKNVEIPFSSLYIKMFEHTNIVQNISHNSSFALNQKSFLFNGEDGFDSKFEQKRNKIISDTTFNPKNPIFTTTQNICIAQSENILNQNTSHMGKYNADRLEQSDISSRIIPTMFGLSFIREHSLSLNIPDSVFLELKTIDCPFNSNYIETLNIENVSENVSNFSLDNLEKSKSDYANKDIHSSHQNFDNIPSQFEVLNHIEKGQVILEDLRFDFSLVFASFSLRYFDTNIPRSTKKILEECLQSIIYCQYVFDAINKLKFPFLFSTSHNEFNSNTPKIESLVFLKTIVLHVKLVKLVINTLETIKLHYSLVFHKIPALFQLSLRLIQYLDITSTQLSINDSFNWDQYNTDDYFVAVTSAETILYKQMIEMCQEAIFEQYFGEVNENFCEKNNIYNICKFLYLTATDTAFYILDPFIKLTK